MLLRISFILLLISVGSFTGFQAQNLLISEDFSSSAWEKELLRLNPGNDTEGKPINPDALNPVAYSTPATTGANAYNNLNSTGLYFEKYKLNGAIETLDVLPCPLGDQYAHVNSSPIEIPFADPTIYSENGKFYLAGTRPGSPLGFVMLESTDLKEWTLSTSDASGMVLKAGAGSYGESGFWAPQFLKVNSTYYMTYTASEHVAIASSPTLNGLYTQSNITSIDPDVKNIDSYLFKDDDGKYYLYHVRFNKGNFIWVAEFNMATGKINKQTLKQCLTKTQAWEATPAYESNIIMEGPTVIKKEGVYYLFYSANHFQSIDYAVGYATATSPLGPWTKHTGNPIIHRSIVGENGSGHGDLFFDQHDNPYYVYHVHRNETTVVPRRTRIVPLTFSFNSSTGKYDISANINGLIIPKVRATGQAQYKAIESNLTGTQKAVAFRFNNNESGMFELPELPHAGEMTLHIRNGNQTSPTELALEKYEDGNWRWLHTFNLQNWGAYPNFRDEILKYDINSTTPVKLRLINNVATTKRYMNLYRIDLSENNLSGITNNTAQKKLQIKGRKITAQHPVSFQVYDLTGKLLISTPVIPEFELPQTYQPGTYIIRCLLGTEKMVLTK
jgi:hypothetical protein